MKTPSRPVYPSASVPRPVPNGVAVAPLSHRAKWAQVPTKYDDPETDRERGDG